MANTFPSYVPTNEISPVFRPRWRGPEFDNAIAQYRTEGFDQIESVWAVEWSAYAVADVEAIDAFLANEAKFNRAFYWTPPTYSTRLYRCPKWSIRYINCDWADLSAKFTEVPE